MNNTSQASLLRLPFNRPPDSPSSRYAAASTWQVAKAGEKAGPGQQRCWSGSSGRGHGPGRSEKCMVSILMNRRVIRQRLFLAEGDTMSTKVEKRILVNVPV